MDWLIWYEVKVAANIASYIDNSNFAVQVAKQIDDKRTEIRQIENHMQTVNGKKVKLLKLYMDDKIDQEMYVKQFDGINTEISDLKQSIDRLNVQVMELQRSLDDNKGTNSSVVVLDNISDFNVRMEYVNKYLKNVWLQRTEDKSIHIEFEWNMPMILPKHTYRYQSKGGKMTLICCNEDGTAELLQDGKKGIMTLE